MARIGQARQAKALPVWAGISLVSLFLLSEVAHGKAPRGWFVTGSAPASYTAGLDKKVKHTGKASGTLRAKPSWRKGFGTLTQVILPDKYRGKRVRLTGWLKTKEVRLWAGMWMRVDNKRRKVLSFDNMEKRPLRGTLPWKAYHIVLDIPKSAARIAFGVLLSGTGQVWLDDFKMEIVSKKIPTTGINTNTLPRTPKNPGFEE